MRPYHRLKVVWKKQTCNAHFFSFFALILLDIDPPRLRPPQSSLTLIQNGSVPWGGHRVVASENRESTGSSRPIMGDTWHTVRCLRHWRRVSPSLGQRSRVADITLLVFLPYPSTSRLRKPYGDWFSNQWRFNLKKKGPGMSVHQEVHDWITEYANRAGFFRNRMMRLIDPKSEIWKSNDVWLTWKANLNRAGGFEINVFDLKSKIEQGRRFGNRMCSIDRKSEIVCVSLLYLTELI